MRSSISKIPAIRSGIRQRRQNLSSAEQQAASHALFNNLLQIHHVRISRRLACYLPINGEIDPLPLFDWALARGKTCYLPVLSHLNGNRLWFAPVDNDTELATNRYGIPEPRVPLRDLVRASQLDLVLLPLVGFDESGNRIGMGGGYYDRSLQLMRYRRHWRKPRLLGVAHEFQKLASIDAQPWDVPLDGIVTDRNIYLVDRGAHA